MITQLVCEKKEVTLRKGPDLGGRNDVGGSNWAKGLDSDGWIRADEGPTFDIESSAMILAPDLTDRGPMLLVVLPHAKNILLIIEEYRVDAEIQ